MSLGAIRRFAKTFTFRLAVSFSAAFILSSLILFGFAFFLVSSSLHENDRAAVRLKLKEYIDEYQKDSVKGVRNKIDSDARSGVLRTYMVRLANSQNKTLFLRPPEEGVNYDFSRLEQSPVAENTPWIELRAADEDDVLDIASFRLPDHSVIQVGKGPEEREDLLNRFQDTFLVVLAAIVALSFAAGIVLARQSLRPVRGLINELGPIIDTGRIKTRIPVRPTGDEFEVLAVRFNQALEKIDSLIEAMRASLDNVAHDLRTPMTRMRGVAEIALQSRPDIEVYREALSDCLEESEQVLQVLNMLMDISEVEAGAVKLEVEEVNVLALMNQVCELYRCVAEDKNIVMAIECPEGLYMFVDRNRLRQVIANLVDNALKYSRAGGDVKLAAAYQGSEIVITITDSGIGIEREDLARIWDRFYRGDKSRTQRGLGLGLSLVKAMIEAHKGKIEVSSEPGRGSCFLISLPFDHTPALPEQLS